MALPRFSRPLLSSQVASPSSGGAKLAIRSAQLERYSTIRRFFRAQAEAASPRRNEASAVGYAARRGDLVRRIKVGLSLGQTRLENLGSPTSSSLRLVGAIRGYSTAGSPPKEGSSCSKPGCPNNQDSTDPSPSATASTSSTPTPSSKSTTSSQVPPSGPGPHGQEPKPPPPPPDHSYYAPFIRRLLQRLPHLPHPPASTHPNHTHHTHLPSSIPPSLKPNQTSNRSPFGGTFNSPHNPWTQSQRPPLHQQPTKEELLRASTSVWQRIKIRWRWFSIRGWRRFNTDDLSAFLSWFVVGNTIWIIIGTTTFFSAVFATLNSLSLQHYVARLLSDYLTKNTGFNVIFESAIVPKWGASTITFRNVYVSRRPVDDDEDDEEEEEAVQKSTPSKVLSAVKSKILAHADDQGIPGSEAGLDAAVVDKKKAKDMTDEEKEEARAERYRQKNNYTMFDLNFDEVEVSLSLPRWLDGKGLVKDAKVRGVRGVIDRRHVFWDLSVPLVPADFRHKTGPGDFELESLQVEDFLVTVYQPGGQRPFNVSFFTATIGTFRKRWMFYDLLSADGITGQYDNCLFSLHKPQKLGKTRQGDHHDVVKRLARFRVDGLPIEHAQYATGFQGPMSWLSSGKIDAVLDIQFPRHPDDEVDLSLIIEHLGRSVAEIAKETGLEWGQEDGGNPFSATNFTKWGEGAWGGWTRGGDADGFGAGTDAGGAAEMAQTAMLASQEKREKEKRELIPGQHRLARPALRAPEADGSAATPPPTPRKPVRESRKSTSPEDLFKNREVKIDIDLRFRDLKATVPLYTTDLSVRNNALIRPIVAFINANRTLIPIHCTVTAPLSDFDGSWTMFETGLTSSISNQIWSALAFHVSSSSANTQRIRTVGTWGVQRGAEAVLSVLRTVVDPMHAEMQAAS